MYVTGLLRGYDRGIVKFILAFALLSLLFWVYIRWDGFPSEVSAMYFPYVEQLKEGIIPDMEYPPFAFVFIGLPGLFSSNPDGYGIAFIVEAFIFIIIGLLISAKIADHFKRSQLTAMALYSAMVVLMLEFVVDRYDVFPMVLTLLTFYLFITKRYTWAWVVLAIATMTKLYPIVILPVLMGFILIDRDWKEMVRGALIFVATAVVIVIPLVLIGSDVMTFFIGYHMDRPLQYESTASSIISMAALLGLTSVCFTFDFGSDNINGPWPDAVAPYLTPVTCILLVAFYMLMLYFMHWMKRTGRDDDGNRAIAAIASSFVAVAIFVIVGKVFSAQYVIWLFPMVLLLMMTNLDRRVKRKVFVSFLMAEALTMFNYLAVNPPREAIFNPEEMVFLFVRNILLIVITYWVLRSSVDHIRDSKPIVEAQSDHVATD